MKKLFFFFLAILISVLALSQNVAINNDGSAADPSAMLDVKSTTKGMLIPRMTTAQRTAIASPALGLMVFDTDTKTIWVYNGTTWANLNSGGGSFTLPYDGAATIEGTAFRITNNNGPAIEGSSVNGSGLYGNSFAGAGLNALSTNGFGVIANSINNSSVYAFSNNASPTIKSSNTSFGAAIEALSANGKGLYANSVQGTAVDVLSTNGYGVIVNSVNNGGIYAYTNTATNTVPTIRANNYGGGIAVHASSSNDAAILGTSSAAGKSAIRGEATGTGISNGIFGSSTSSAGNGIYGFNSSTGVGVLGSSPNGYGVSAFSLNGTGLRASSTNGIALDVYGKLKITGTGSVPGAGYVLTSIDNAGNADWMQLDNPKIAFRAQGVSEAVTNNSANNTFTYSVYKKVEFQAEDYDLNNNFSPTGSNPSTSNTSTFVVPRNGIYHFDATVIPESNLIFNYTRLELRIQMNRGGTVYTLAHIISVPGTPTGESISVSTDRALTAGDKIWVEFAQFNTAFGFSDLRTEGYLNFFSGHIVIPQ